MQDFWKELVNLLLRTWGTVGCLSGALGVVGFVWLALALGGQDFEISMGLNAIIVALLATAAVVGLVMNRRGPARAGPLLVGFAAGFGVTYALFWVVPMLVITSS